MKVLDLYSGLGGWSAPARDRGHEVTRVELDPRFPAEVHADILTLTADDLRAACGGTPDLVLASPPCEAWSVMALSRGWRPVGRKQYEPKSPKAEEAVALLAHTLDLIAALDPAYWVLENPRGMMRTHPLVAPYERRTVTYCHYGEPRMKPTDLWSAKWPPSLRLAPACRNGDPCHVRAPRGSLTGTQGMAGERSGYWHKSVVPYPLAAAVLDAAEVDLAAARYGSAVGTLWRMR